MKKNELRCNLTQRRIGIIGLGYVGLPLALLFVKKGFNVIGIDVDKEKIDNINNLKSYLCDISNEELKNAMNTGRLSVTEDYNIIPDLEVIIICVPTPLNQKKEPDLSALINVATALSKKIRLGQTIIIESTTYPGTTREIIMPLLEQSNLLIGRDIFLGYSPERIDPGNNSVGLEEVPKIISGISKKCEWSIKEIYEKVFKDIIVVSSTEVAEFTKLLENSYRLINIAFINELAILCDRLKIDIWEAISAATSKPYGYSPFYPGPGAGGHCIPIDPLYLLWKSRITGGNNKFIDLASELNQDMQKYVVSQIKNHIGNKNQILICGLSYKKNINDMRESPAIQIYESLIKENFIVSFYDPYIAEIEIENQKYKNSSITEELLKNIDCVLILTDHNNMPIQKILDYAPLVYDTRNSTLGLKGKAKVIRLGGG